MAKLSKDEFIEKLKAYTGDRTDDETLSLIEDASDSYTDAPADDSEDWHAKYDDLAKKYKDRFTEKIEVKDDPEPKEEKEDDEKDDISVDDLFEEED